MCHCIKFRGRRIYVCRWHRVAISVMRAYGKLR
jgi:hypothetical protein